MNFMQMKELTQPEKQKYIDKMVLATTDFNDMFNQMNKKLLAYSDVHYKMTKDIISVNHAKEQEKILTVEIKNINRQALDQAVTNLQALREEYLKEYAPKKEPTTDPLELSFIEKELAVMSENELNTYCNENYLDANILRLCKIEFKKRNKIFIEKTNYSDNITNTIDNEINAVIALRSISSTCLAFNEILGDDIRRVQASWGPILEQIGVRSARGPQRFNIKDFYK